MVWCGVVWCGDGVVWYGVVGGRVWRSVVLCCGDGVLWCGGVMVWCVVWCGDMVWWYGVVVWCGGVG